METKRTDQGAMINKSPRSCCNVDRGVTVLLVFTALGALGLVICLSLFLENNSIKGLHRPVPATGYNIVEAEALRAVPKSTVEMFTYATVIADSKVCSDIGTEILARKGGNAIDAAVASLLCDGVVSGHSTGIGGGSLFVVYHKEKGWHAVDSRETAPFATDLKDTVFSGGRAAGVPGQLKGLWEVHARFGRVSWSELVVPSVKLCQEGVAVTEELHRAVLESLESLENTTQFNMYLDSDGLALPVGTVIKFPTLASTLLTLANDPDSFYNGSLAEDIVQDLQDVGGLLTLQDLQTYTADWSSPISLPLLDNLTLYTAPSPVGGPGLAFVMNVLAGYGLSANNVSTEEGGVRAYHLFIETLNMAYSKLAQLGEENVGNDTAWMENLLSSETAEEIRAQINAAYRTNISNSTGPHSKSERRDVFSMANDVRTAHLSVLDGDGNAVAVYSSLTSGFGNKVQGNRTGIVFNNAMTQFKTSGVTLPQYGSDVSGRRPMTAICPVMVWDNQKNELRLVMSSSRMDRILTVSAQVLVNALWLDMSIQAAIDFPRLHPLASGEVSVEGLFRKSFQAALAANGHRLTTEDSNSTSTVHAIFVTDAGQRMAIVDYRGEGQPGGF